MQRDEIRRVAGTLFAHAEATRFAGFDPYDGLNSRFFRGLWLHHSAFLRLAWIQFFKRSQINFRPLLGVPKSFNPKAGALFLSGSLRLSGVSPAAKSLLARLKKTAITTTHGCGWGYNFDWQSRAFFVPRGTPNIVSTVYVGNALLDYLEKEADSEAGILTEKIRSFILNEMIIWEKADQLCFAYIPGKKTEVHNANLWAAAYLSRLERRSPLKDAADKVRKAVQFSVSDISPDGRWPYGTQAHHRWMDNFHTAFNLEALMEIHKTFPSPDYEKVLTKMLPVFYEDFFMNDGIPKYFRDKLYPVDIHTIAESIVVLSKAADSPEILPKGLREKASALCEKVLEAAFADFWDKKDGYFYYQRHAWGMNRISYIRWSQAWMYYALAVYLAKPDQRSVHHVS